MNKNMADFKTQVCTTIEQSKQLIDLGINPDTADMGWFKAYSLKGEIYKPFIKEYKLENYKTDIPAWSLHRLIEMYSEHYVCEHINLKLLTYDTIIENIRLDILTGTFNKEYLEQ